MIILFIWITITIIIFISLAAQIKLSIYNIEKNSYVKVNFLMFTMHLNYERFMQTIKKLGIKNNIDYKTQINFYINMNPLLKELVKKTVVEKAKFYKFFDEYSEMYKVVTFYLLSAYLNSFLENNCKKNKDFKYEVVYSKEREDLDFSFVCKISVFNILFSFIKNIKPLFKYIKRRAIHGS